MDSNSPQAVAYKPAIPVADLPGADQAAGPGIRLELKHPRAIRWMHWINFPILFTMIWSGLLIYWGDSDNAYQHPAPHLPRSVSAPSPSSASFPEPVYRWLNAPYRITTGLGWHFFFMWIFAINGLIYVTYLIVSGEWRLLVPTLAVVWRGHPGHPLRPAPQQGPSAREENTTAPKRSPTPPSS